MKQNSVSEPVIFDYIIMGAGISALNLARRLKLKKPSAKIKLCEKSRGCGGRLATRRTEDLKFDHGAQFVSAKSIPEDLLRLWQDQSVVQSFDENKDRVCAIAGITQLAKTLTQGLDVTYDFKITQVYKQNDNWVVMSENQEAILGHNFVMTAPVPQVLEILEKSGIRYNLNLKSLLYTKAVVVLLQTHTEDSDQIYQEHIHNDILSVAAQHKKGNSARPAWTVVMSPA